MICESLTTTMPTVKVLALHGIGPDLDAVLDILKCFPCLERFYIIVSFNIFLLDYHVILVLPIKYLVSVCLNIVFPCISS